MPYQAIGYRRDHYDVCVRDCQSRDIAKVWRWVEEFLAVGNRTVVVYRSERKHGRGRWHTKKIWKGSRVEDIPVIANRRIA